DFGDLDIVVSSTPEEIYDKIAAIALELRSKEIVKNGPVTSLEVDNFQLDIISTSLDSVDIYEKKKTSNLCRGNFQMTVDFMSWGDTSTLIGIIAKKMNLKFGNLGLELPVFFEVEDEIISKEDNYEVNLNPLRLEDFKIEKLMRDRIILQYILLSTDMIEILNFLGFNSKIWQVGFKKEQEIFDFIQSSTYFNRNLFDSAKIGCNNRKRMKSRPMFLNFINSLNTLVEDTVADRLSQEDFKNFHYERAINTFKKKDEIEKILQNYLKLRLFKKKFNSKVIMKVLQIEEFKKVRELKVKFEKLFCDKDTMISKVLEIDQESLENLIRSLI
ncbi:hypothetical protein HK099_008401, partial [Clydaea vesicula]